MSKYIPLTFIDLHSPLFMQGSNLGNKINAVQKGAKLMLDVENNVIWIQFKGKTSFIPLANTASGDALVSEEFLVQLGFAKPAAPIYENELSGPPAVRRGKKQKLEQLGAEVLTPEEEHRREVRERSANSNKPTAANQTDTLLQQARGQALGFGNAQVSNPTMPAVGQGPTPSMHVTGANGAGVTGKPKAINHQQLRAQLAAETKEVK